MYIFKWSLHKWTLVICLCVLFQITSWPAVPTLKECGKSSLTARAVHLGSRGVLPTPCFTWCGLALYFSVSVIRYEIQKSMCTRFDLHWCTTFSKDNTHCSLAITARSVLKFFQFSHIFFFYEIRPSLRSWLFWLPMGYSSHPSLVDIFRVSQLWRSLGRHFRFKGVCKCLATEYNHSATLKQCKSSFRVKAAWPSG